MLGLVISLVASGAPALPVAGAASMCGDEPGRCEVAEVMLAPAERTYATPAVIDCRRANVPAVLAILVGECDGTPRDASYRASRYPDSEQVTTTVVPGNHDRRSGPATCQGVPPKHGDLTRTSVPVLVLFATPSLLPPVSDAPPPPQVLRRSTRSLDPLERPPRA
jgi:hypothetical protein